MSQLAHGCGKSGAGNGPTSWPQAVRGESIAGQILAIPLRRSQPACSCAAAVPSGHQLRSLQRARNRGSRRAQYRAGAAGEAAHLTNCRSLTHFVAWPSVNARLCHDELHDRARRAAGRRRMDVSWSRYRVATSDAEVQAHFNRVHEALQAGTRSSVESSRICRPTLLDNLGLFPALRWQVAGYLRARGTALHRATIPPRSST